MGAKTYAVWTCRWCDKEWLSVVKKEEKVTHLLGHVDEIFTKEITEFPADWTRDDVVQMLNKGRPVPPDG